MSLRTLAVCSAQVQWAVSLLLENSFASSVDCQRDCERDTRLYTRIFEQKRDFTQSKPEYEHM